MISPNDFEVFYTQNKQQLESYLQTLNSQRNEQGKIDNLLLATLDVQEPAVKLLIGVFSDIPIELGPYTDISQLSKPDIIHFCCIVMDKYQLTFDTQDFNNIATAYSIATNNYTVEYLYDVVSNACSSLNL